MIPYQILIAPSADDLDAVDLETLGRHFQAIRAANPDLGKFFLSRTDADITHVMSVTTFFSRSCYITKPEKFNEIAAQIRKIPGVLGVTRALTWAPNVEETIFEMKRWGEAHEKVVTERAAARDEQFTTVKRMIDSIEQRNQLLYQPTTPLHMTVQHTALTDVFKESGLWKLEGVVICFLNPLIIPAVMISMGYQRQLKCETVFFDHTECCMQERVSSEILPFIRKITEKQIKLEKAEKLSFQNQDFELYKFYSHHGYFYKLETKVSTPFLDAKSTFFLYPLNQEVYPK